MLFLTYLKCFGAPVLTTAIFCSNFEDIFNVKHFIDSLRDEVRIVRRVPKRFNRKSGYKVLEMPPVSWSDEKYYLEQVRILAANLN